MNVIGLAGVARSGKDTFCNYAVQFLAEKKITCTRKAFADKLKADLKTLCTHQIGINSFTGNPEEKEVIRPLLVTYGTDIMRKIDDRWWIDQLNTGLDMCRELNITPIIVDVRYENEMDWIQQDLKGICVHITRKGIRAANKEERAENPTLRKKANYRMSWPTFGEDNLEKCRKQVYRVMKKIHHTHWGS